MLLSKTTDMNLKQFGICIQSSGLKNMLPTRYHTCKASTHFSFFGVFTTIYEEILHYFQVFNFYNDGLAKAHYCGFFTQQRNPVIKKSFANIKPMKILHIDLVTFFIGFYRLK